MTYSQPALTEDTLSDGSKVYGVFISGDCDIQIQCTNKALAESLIMLWDTTVIDVEVSTGF